MPALASSRLMAPAMKLGRVGVGLLDVHLHVLVEHRLALGDLLRRLGGDVAGEGHRLFVEIVGRHDAAHQPVAQRGRGVDRTGR